MKAQTEKKNKKNRKQSGQMLKKGTTIPASEQENISHQYKIESKVGSHTVSDYKARLTEKRIHTKISEYV